MPVIANTHPSLIRVEPDRPPRIVGLLYGLLLVVPLWAGIVAILL